MRKLPIRSLPYYGGKNRGLGKWIVSQLPPVEPGQLYVEPFAGGVNLDGTGWITP